MPPSSAAPNCFEREAAESFLATAEDSMGGRRVGAYRIVRELGRGGMGRVYLAERDDAQYAARVAVKLVAGPAAAPGLAERFATERQVLADLRHPGIARLLDAGVTGEGLAYAIRATEPEGVCQSVSFHPGKTTPLPMGRMYTLGIRFFVGRCHAAALMPEVVALIERGALRPQAVTTHVVGWEDAPHRVLRNSTVEAWEAAARPAMGDRPGEGDEVARRADGSPVLRYSSALPLDTMEGDIEALSLWAGQSVGVVGDVQPARAIVEELVREATRALGRGAP